MKKQTTLGLALAAVLSATLSLVSSTQCVTSARGGVVYVDAAPPEALVEVVGTAPAPNHVWIRGYHRWNGSGYVWWPGRWEQRPRARAVWVDGHWEHHARGWYWIAGHWD
jgi:hypothetical protein